MVKKSAEIGQPEAQAVLGLEYLKGETVSKDKVRALMWFLVAASNDGPTILGGFKKRVEGIAWTLTDSNKEKLKRMLRDFYAPDVTSTQVPSLRFSVPQKNREPDQ